jgi:hypothetical protein
MFTNGFYLTGEVAQKLKEAGLAFSIANSRREGKGFC